MTCPPGSATRSDEQELRLALVLNGGVSLAVWIGGAVHEVNRLVQRRERVYDALLRLTEIGRASCREKCRSRWSPYH